ncbi:MAG: response regulator [bacterium]|nr:response regulator [bacterium]
MSNILVVDDDRGIRKGIALALRQSEHKVTEAATGIEALGIIKQKCFDLIISDLRLPEMNGLTLLEKIKEINPFTAVIMITSYGTLKTAVEAGKRGAFDFIDKNFSLEELKLKVSKALESQEIQRNSLKPIEDKGYFKNQLGKKSSLELNKEKYLRIINTIKEDKDKEKLIDLFGGLMREISLKENEINKMIIEMSSIYEELSLFYRVSKSFSSLYDLDKIYKIAISSSVRQINVKKGMIGIVKKDSDHISIKSTIGFNGDLVNSHIVHKSYFENALLSGKPIIDNRVSEHKDEYFGIADNNSIIVPFTVNDHELGFLCLFDKIEDEFNTHDMRAIATIAYQCSISIEKATYYQESHDLFLDSVQALSSAIDAKDKYTYGHSSRVAKYAAMIADKLDLSKKEIDEAYLAGLLHDIGKIGTPLEILHKTGPLTHGEFDIIKEHPIQSAKIIKFIKKLTNVIPSILAHHEHFNGAGYPSGLKGKDIPLIGRILCVADAFDAMTSDRPYRKKMTLKEALYQMKCCSERQFDPMIVNVFTSYSIEVGKLYSSFHEQDDVLVSSVNF